MPSTGVSNWIRNTAPPAISGSGGHSATYTVACSLWRMLGDESAVWAGLCEYNAARCKPAWSEKELRHKMLDAEKATRGERNNRTHQPRRRHPRASLDDMRRALASPVTKRSGVASPQPADVARPLGPELLVAHMTALPELPAARDFERVTRIIAGNEVAALPNIVHQTPLADERVIVTWMRPTEALR